MPQYARILLKLSGEVLAGGNGFGIEQECLHRLAAEVAEVARTGVQIGLVVGGGNFFRGVSAAAHNMDRVAADHMGMLATVINAIALQDALGKAGHSDAGDDGDFDAFGGGAVYPAASHPASEKGRIVIFGAGTSNPYFSTDTAATLRGLEIHAEVVAKATSVDGVYNKDPHKHSDAVRYESITFQEVLARQLGVMDASAVAMCRDNKLPICIFDLRQSGNIMRVAMGESVGTLIQS